MQLPGASTSMEEEEQNLVPSPVKTGQPLLLWTISPK
jgi:hypothetical protein